MRRRSWGRLGAAVGVVALLAGGLVGVAAPAQAGHAGDEAEVCFSGDVDTDVKTDGIMYTDAEREQAVEDAERQLQAACSAEELSLDHYTCYDPIENSVVVGPCWPLIRGPGEREGGLVVQEATAYGLPPLEDTDGSELVQLPPPPPPCWDASINNCPVGGALRFAAPRYAMVGVPVTMYAYASWRPDANAPSQPTNGTAVIRVDGEDYSGVEFVDGVAEWRFIPETEGMKEFTASGVLFSGLSGANAYIDTVPARTYVLEYDPAAYATALKNKAVEVGDTYVITDPNQARSYAEDRYEWSVSSKSEDVCAVYETKKGAVKAKFTDSGKCTVIWLDKESEETGKYTFIAKK